MPAMPKDMSYITASTLFWATAFVALVWLLPRSPLRISSSRETQPQCDHDPLSKIKSSDPKACLDIMAAKSFYTQGYSIKNILTIFEARAVPNQRLVRAFGIHNSFVTSEREESAAFRKQVETLVYVEEDKWDEFATVARGVVRTQLEAHEPSLKLGEFVQLITLKMVRKVIWDIEPEDMVPPHANDSDNKLRILARAINLQWLSSKSERPGTQAADDTATSQDEMQAALMATFPGWDGSDSATNPLNFILPAYETLWRVVLLCFIEINARPHLNRAKWSAALQNFLEAPARERLEKPLMSSDEPVSAIMVAKEVLRLYPPTRRVYRRFQDEAGTQYSVAADIEAMQRDPAVWGEDAALLRPERWTSITQAMEDDGRWLPFGAKPFRCPAKRHQGVAMPFGVSMIALLTGALLEATEDRWEFQGRGDLPHIDIPLETGRGAYDSAKLVRRVHK
ncbi:Putative cytochrome P450 superfamily [Septoria linicola]|uniref:Cytochrome P450 superfamily n=1 Tax=Septoria linicola TaxID=215465 RepID=A0A9Q9AR55_9PEZI|nr:putative cytochrome P450 superfamily [Septoria linicola]USW50541.1 Putative cytochrome P450 superfamily [Septoria linicola]